MMIWRLLRSAVVWGIMNIRKDISFGLTQWCMGIPHCIVNRGKIEIARSCRINSCMLSVSNDGEIHIGKNTSLGKNNIIVAREKISIGEKCSIGPNVCIYDNDHCFGAGGKEAGFRTAEVIIGDNVWIGAGVIILRGTTIGNDCVIGAGGVIQGTVPENTLVKADRKVSFIKLE